MTHTNGQDSIIEKRSVLRTLVCRETDLINNRITWLLTSQTILFLAFSNFYKEFEHTNPLPIIIISALGLSVNISSKSSLNVSIKAINYYRKIDKKIVDEDEENNSSKYVDKNEDKNEENNCICNCNCTYSKHLRLDSKYLPLDYDIQKYYPNYDDNWFPWKILPWLFGIAWFCFPLLTSFDAINQWIGIEEHFSQLFCPSNSPRLS